MKKLNCHVFYLGQLTKNRIKSAYEHLCEFAKNGEDCGGYLFGEENQESFIWIDKYKENYNAFRKEVKKIEDKYNIVKDIYHIDICKVRKNNHYYHISESDSSFYRMTFYKILTINNEKYLRMEFMTFPGYKNKKGYRKIKYVEYSQEIVLMNRDAYIKHIVEHKSPLLTTESNCEQKLNINQVKLKNLLKNDFYNNVCTKFLDVAITSYCSESEVFYFCDAMVNNLNKGRTNLNLFDVTLDTKDGDYFCFGFRKKYRYEPNNVPEGNNYDDLEYLDNIIDRDYEKLREESRDEFVGGELLHESILMDLYLF